MTLDLPYLALRTGERIDGLVFSFVDERSQATRPPGPEGALVVFGSVNLIPICVELSDTPDDWLPEKDNQATFRVRLRPETIGGLPVEGKVKVYLENPCAIG